LYNQLSPMTVNIKSSNPVIEICSIQLNKDQQNRTLKISAIGQAPNSGWEKPRLKLRDSKRPPYDGIYEFDFFARGPELNSKGSMDSVIAIFKWENYPSDLRGIRVFAESNSMLMML